MKKYIATFSLLLILVTGASTASAQGYSFTRDLSVGAEGPDVVAIQDMLLGAGFDIPALSRGLSGKGYFGSQTMAALARYQASLGLPATGYFGPMTRGRLGGGWGNSAAVTVTSPNGGETWSFGSTETIRWNAAGSSNTTPISIYLVKNISGCFNAGTRPCLAVVDPEFTIATNLANAGSYQWNVGSYSQAEWGGSITEGANYFVRICRGSDRNITGACDASNSTFSISPGTSGTQAPVIKGVDAPTTLVAGETGTWTIRASDPRNESLNYSVDWGDVAYFIAPESNTVSSPQFVQSTSFTHSYANPGTYTVRFTVRNASGLTDVTSVTIRVTGPSSDKILRIVTPNGGELLERGTTHTIMWSSSNFSRTTYADLKLVPYYKPCASQVCPMGAQNTDAPTSMMYPYIAPYTIASNVRINQNSYKWSVGDVRQITPTPYAVPSSPIAPEGEYTIQICEIGTAVCDSSDAPFTITSSIGNIPDINIVSPNGGEFWPAGTEQLVRVRVSGDSSQIGNTANLFLVDSTNDLNSWYFLGSLSVDNSTGIKSRLVIIPASRIPGTYRIYATLSSSSAGNVPVIQAYDYSDNYFTITPVGDYYYISPGVACPTGYVCN
jgi:peptidoglycan hydrolase-like protein with peptidoglycan-binding domain